MVSMGLTPSAFSMSVWRQYMPDVRGPSFLTAQAVQAELVYSSQRVWILPVVLDDVDVVGCREKPGKSR